MEEYSGPVAILDKVSRSFGSHSVLKEVSFELCPGEVFGLVGENGAGKTTIIKHMLGLLRPDRGSVSLFGKDPVACPESVLGRIGYLSEDRDLPGWMRVEQLMRYTRAFYPRWDAVYAEQLREMFELDPNSRLKRLSRGQLAKAGLLSALAHRPPLLLLDEPSSGLDVIVRREILTAIIRAVADEGRTVLFSSHLLEEVERVADRVGMILEGRLILCAPMEEIKCSHHHLVIRLKEGGCLASIPLQGTLLSQSATGNLHTLLYHGDREEVRLYALNSGAEVLDIAAPSLEEIFIAYARNNTRKGIELCASRS